MGRLKATNGISSPLTTVQYQGFFEREQFDAILKRLPEEFHPPQVLKAQLASIEALKKRGILCPYIFHREDGSPILDFKKLWRKACEDAGYPGKLFHDFRRTAVRNLERAAVPRSTAMAMVGHKTESIYRRYAIVDEAMHREAAAKLDVWPQRRRPRRQPNAEGRSSGSKSR